MAAPQLKIAIVGGGPAGLTLGLLLNKYSIPFTIFELRPQPTNKDFDKPAGPLDLHEDSGLAAIRRCDIYDKFMLLTGDCSEEQRIAGKDGSQIYVDDGGSNDRPEISRLKLIKLLVSHLPSSSIKWGHKLSSAKSSTSGGHTEVGLDFGENGKHKFDLVVGADGAWSKVRPMLTEAKPEYSGYQVITLNIRKMTTNYPRIAELVGSGTFTVLADRHGVISQRSVHNSARIYGLVHTEDEHFVATNGLGSKTPAEAEDFLLGADSPYSTWGEPIKELLAISCLDESVNEPGAAIDIKPLYNLPSDFEWQHQPGVTMLGDAAHLKSLGAGEGVNLAMHDALMLSEAIIRANEVGGQNVPALQKVLDPLIDDFETNMVARAKEAAKGINEVNKMMFGSNEGSQALAGWFKSFRISDKEE